MKREDNKLPNQTPKFPPNSIGGMLGDALREKLLNSNTKNGNDENTENSIKGKGKNKRPKKETDGIGAS